MSDTTPVLHLPYILPSQAQKHVTHNESIRLLDVIVQLSVAARTLATPPSAPAQGDRYIIPTGATGDWAGQGGKIALFENGAWQFFTPLAGWTAWVQGEQVLTSYTGNAWVSQADGPFNVGSLGISATPDAVNRLSVSAQATLLNHAGASHRLKINKAAAGDTASLLFQTGFSGRAEMGTMGSDDFAVKVSADGSAFVTGLSIAAATGQVTLPAAARLGGQATDPINPPNGTLWLNSTTGEVKLRSAGATVVLAAGATGLADGDKGDITVSASGAVWVIDAGAVSNAKLAAMPSATFKARLSAGTGAPEDITAADAASLLPQFSPSAKGLVPASGGGATNYLRADGSWAAPTGGAVTLASLGVGVALIQRQSFTNLSVVDFTLPNAAEYRNALFTWRITGFSNTTNILGARVSTTAGSFSAAVAYNYMANFADTGGGGGFMAYGATDFLILGAATGTSVHGCGRINGYGLTGPKFLQFQTAIAAAADRSENGACRFYGNTSPLLALRFFPASTATMTGEIIMYGERL